MRTNVTDVTDSDGNNFYETPYLAQETIFDEVQNIELEAWAGDVEVKGQLTRGMTVFEKRQGRKTSHNLEVARVVDASAARQAVIKYLNR